MKRETTDKQHSRGVSRDMSPSAIARRLDVVSQLRSFTQFLGQAKRVEKNRQEPES
jgi:hypothetical protein